MPAVLIGLLAFLVVYKIFGGQLSKIIFDRAEKDLNKAIEGKNGAITPTMSGEIESIIARHVPNMTAQQRVDLSRGVRRILKGCQTGEVTASMTQAEQELFLNRAMPSETSRIA